MNEPIYPDPPTRIVEPIVSPETAGPSPAVVCEECKVSGNEALAKSTERSHTKPQSHKGSKSPGMKNEEPGTKNDELES